MLINFLSDKKQLIFFVKKYSKLFVFSGKVRKSWLYAKTFNKTVDTTQKAIQPERLSSDQRRLSQALLFGLSSVKHKIKILISQQIWLITFSKWTVMTIK